MPSLAPSALTTPLLTVGLLLSGCSAESAGSDRNTDPVTIKITEKDGRIDPSGDTVNVDQGQDITLVVSSDAEDEIHVHSEPEHEFPIAGRGVQRITFSIDSPGTYEVESHELNVVIVKLQVS
jgi:hypothetical protein